MGLIEYSEASDFYGPRPNRDLNNVEALEKLLKSSNQLLYVITHPKLKNVYAQIDPHLNIQVFQGVQNELGYAFVAREKKLLVLQQKTAHWHLNNLKTQIISGAGAEVNKAMAELFTDRVAQLISGTG